MIAMIKNSLNDREKSKKEKREKLTVLATGQLKATH